MGGYGGVISLETWHLNGFRTFVLDYDVQCVTFF